MAESRALTAVNEAEYEAIEAAVMETARGRWFLAEYASRNRTADTRVLLEAIGRLEQAVTGEHAAQSLDRVRFDLMEMAKAISRTKTEIAALHPSDHPHSHLIVASEALDGITRTTERATSEILEAAEHVQETAWTLREEGTNPTLCDELDRRATEIYTACSFQDLTAQRMGRIVQTLRYLEGRINAMIDIWGGTSAPEDQAPADPAPRQAEATGEGDGLSQSDVDIVIVEDALFGAGPAAEPSAGTAEVQDAEVQGAETWDAQMADAETGDAQAWPATADAPAPEAADDETAWASAAEDQALDDAILHEADPGPDADGDAGPGAVVMMDGSGPADEPDMADDAFVEAKAAELLEQMMTRIEPGPALLDAGVFAEIDALETMDKLRRFT